MLCVEWSQIERIDVHKTPYIFKAGEGPGLPARIRLYGCQTFPHGPRKNTNSLQHSYIRDHDNTFAVRCRCEAIGHEYERATTQLNCHLCDPVAVSVIHGLYRAITYITGFILLLVSEGINFCFQN